MAGMIKGIFGLSPEQLELQRKKNLSKGLAELSSQKMAAGEGALETGAGMLIGTMLAKKLDESGFLGEDLEMQQALEGEKRLEEIRNAVLNGDQTPEQTFQLGMNLSLSSDESSRDLGKNLLSIAATQQKNAVAAAKAFTQVEAKTPTIGTRTAANRFLRQYADGENPRGIEINVGSEEDINSQGIDEVLSRALETRRAEYNTLIKNNQMKVSDMPTENVLFQEAMADLEQQGVFSLKENKGIFSDSIDMNWNLAGTPKQQSSVTDLSETDQEILNKYNTK
tara:strand:- start:5312 stop:6154 length:843 start_codon:yes stop_codon:yes gene_type:complete